MDPRAGITRLMNLRQGRKDWYKITARAGGAVVTIYDDVGYFGVTARDFAEDVAAIKGDLELHINSPGGEVFDGLAIYNSLAQRPGQVRVVVDSLAASICSVIAQAASPGELVMAKAASMMIHEAHGGLPGTAAEQRQLADVLDKQSDIIAGVYADRSGRPAAQWREAMRAETWYGADEAVAAGLADSVLPGRAAAPQNAAVDNSPWDAGRAWANGAASDDPAAFYNGICAGKKAGDPATQGAHALPHHYHPGDPPNRHGVSAALGRLSGTDGLTNRAAAESHLKAHQSAISPDHAPSGHLDLSGWDPQVFRNAFIGG